MKHGAREMVEKEAEEGKSSECFVLFLCCLEACEQKTRLQSANLYLFIYLFVYVFRGENTS